MPPQTNRMAQVKAAQETAKAIRARGNGWTPRGEFSFRVPQHSRDSLVVFHSKSDSITTIRARDINLVDPDEIGLVDLVLHAGRLWRAGKFEKLVRD